MTVLHLPDEDALFCGDSIQDRMTAFLLEGRLSPWLEQITKLRAAFPDVKRWYPGHGEPGLPSELAKRQAEYLAAFRNVVRTETHGDTVVLEEERRILEAMETRYPNYVPVAAIPDLLRRNIAPVAKELHAPSALSADGDR